MDIEALRKFLLASIYSGYAATGEDKATKESDHSKSIVFEQGDFKAHDNWFGGEPYGGRTVVFFQGKPVWTMVYYGSVDPDVVQVKDIYTFLHKALLKVPESMPLRGPSTFTEGSWEYKNATNGDLGIFSGDEIIVHENKPVYSATYAGGFIDVRKEA